MIDWETKTTIKSYIFNNLINMVGGVDEVFGWQVYDIICHHINYTFRVGKSGL